jgi:hypothetical protein
MAALALHFCNHFSENLYSTSAKKVAIEDCSENYNFLSKIYSDAVVKDYFFSLFPFSLLSPPGSFEERLRDKSMWYFLS